MAFITMRLDWHKKEKKSLAQKRTLVHSNKQQQRAVGDGARTRRDHGSGTGRQEELKANDEVILQRKVIQQHNLNLKSKIRAAQIKKSHTRSVLKITRKTIKPTSSFTPGEIHRTLYLPNNLTEAEHDISRHRNY